MGSCGVSDKQVVASLRKHKIIRSRYVHHARQGLLPARPFRSDAQTDRHNPIFTLSLRMTQQIPAGILGIPRPGTLRGPPDRTVFGLIDAIRHVDSDVEGACPGGKLHSASH